jgi:hypothetical protein
MKMDGNKEYGQDSPQQVEMDTKYSAASPLNSVLSPNTERRTPNFSPQSCSFLTSHHLFTDVCIDLLNVGQGVRFRAKGWSMHPTICDGEIIHVEPVLPSEVKHRDIILYKSPRGVTAHRVVHIQREMEPHEQASDPIQPPMWGDISRLVPGQAGLKRRIFCSARANSALSPQPSVKLSGHWVIRLLDHFWASLSPNSERF